MSAAIPSRVPWQWSADVLTYAAEHGVAEYLEPLLEATRRLFPTAVGLRVFLEKDPELRDVTFLIFEARVPRADIPDYLEARHRWGAELRRICPSHLAITFTLSLLRVT